MDKNNSIPRPGIQFATGECSLGIILVAVSEQGLCAIFLGDHAQPLIDHLQTKFPNAEPMRKDEQSSQFLDKVTCFVENPALGLDLPLHLQGTAFQKRVWQALREIPVGATASYIDIARKINAPRSARAVARACAANLLAVVIPCHRVVKKDHSLSGYRWGGVRKHSLLEKESNTQWLNR